MTKPRLTVKEALAEILHPMGKTVVDIGCGEGAIVRHLAALGAQAIGVEVSEGQLARARSEAGDGARYEIGRGEELPFSDGFADALLYLNSFHHLPVDAMPTALVEAGRVLKAGGMLIVIEPLAEGAYFEAMRPIEDETEVRAKAYAALGNPPPSLRPEAELFYESIIRLPDVEHFLKAVCAPDPRRREKLPFVEGELRRRFEAYKRVDALGTYFIAPMRRNVFLRQ